MVTFTEDFYFILQVFISPHMVQKQTNKCNLHFFGKKVKVWKDPYLSKATELRVPDPGVDCSSLQSVP